MRPWALRWAVRGTLILGLAASTTGNVLHAQDNWISRAISAWPVLALYLAIELIARVPITGRALAYCRHTAAAVIALIAAWVSYWHMYEVALRYGETRDAAHLLPLSVDGLIVVASICLVELGGRTRGESNGTVRQGSELPEAEGPAGLGLQGAGGSERQQGEGPEGDPQGAGKDQQEVAAPNPEKVSTRRKPHPSSADRVVRAHKRTPQATDKELAKRLNLSERTVKNYRPPVAPEGAQPSVNGSTPHLEGAQ